MLRPVAALLIATCLACAGPNTLLAQERIVLRFGAHDGYDRVVIDWPSNVDYDVDVDERDITVRFARMAELDVAPVARRLGARVSGMRAAAFPGGTALSFVLSPGVQLRHFRNRSSIVLDLARKAASDIVDPASTRRLDQEKAGRLVPVPMPPPASTPVPPAAAMPAATPPAATPPAAAPPALAMSAAPPIASPASPPETGSVAAAKSPASTAVTPSPPPPVVPPRPETPAAPFPPAPGSAPAAVSRPRPGASASLTAACAGDFETALARLAAMPAADLAPADMYNLAWLRRMLGEPAALASTMPTIDAEVVGACSGRRVAVRPAELWRGFAGGRLPPEPIRIIDVAPVAASTAPVAAPRPMQPQPGGSPR